jgi:hypothetical protein
MGIHVALCPAIKQKQSTALRSSRGVGIAAPPLAYSVRFDSCGPYLLLVSYIRPAIMACGILERSAFILDANPLENANCVTPLVSWLHNLCLLTVYKLVLSGTFDSIFHHACTLLAELSFDDNAR